MLKLKDLEGWPVVNGEGKQLGVLECVLLDEELKIKGAVIRISEQDKRYVASSDLMLGDDLVWVPGPGCFKPLAEGEKFNYESMLGREVYDVTGNPVGVAADFLIDPAQGMAAGLVLSDGLLADFVKGRMSVSMENLKYDGRYWVLSEQRSE